MNKEVFMRELINGLKELGEQEQKQVCDYYEELICDGMESGRSEEAVVESFGSPGEITAQIRAEYSVRATKGSQAPVQTEYKPAGEVHSVVVNAHNVRVNVRTVPQGSVRVLFQPRENDKVSYTEENGVFSFHHSIDLFNVWSWIDILRGPHDITLEVPAAFAGNLQVTSSNASVSAEGLSKVDSCVLTTSNARVRLKNCTCNSIAANSANGSIFLNGLTGTRCEAITSNSRIVAEQCNLGEHLWLQTSNSSVRADKIAAPDLLLQTANASITALVVGDAKSYSIASNTTNARNNLPPTWGGPEQPNSLRAATSNGRIEVHFTEE